MKNITYIFLILLIIATNSLFAQTSNLTVFSESGERFKLFLNNVEVNAAYMSNVENNNLAAGRYVVKIDFEDLYVSDIAQTISIMGGYDIKYIIKKNKKGEYKLRGFSMTETNYNSPNNGGTNGSNYTNPNTNGGGLVIEYDENVYDGTTNYQDEFTIEYDDGLDNANYNTNNTGNTNISVNYNFLGTEIGMNFNLDDFFADPNYTDNGFQTKTAPTGCYGAMNNYNFTQAKQQIANQTFPDEKKSTAMQIIGANCFYSQQVKELVELMEYEDDRLEVAKFAYHHTLDLGNYFLVNNAFTFDSTKDELRDYINSLK